jgi:hypothetical protein
VSLSRLSKLFVELAFLFLPDTEYPIRRQLWFSEYHCYDVIFPTRLLPFWNSQWDLCQSPCFYLSIPSHAMVVCRAMRSLARWWKTTSSDTEDTNLSFKFLTIKEASE